MCAKYDANSGYNLTSPQTMTSHPTDKKYTCFPLLLQAESIQTTPDECVFTYSESLQAQNSS